MAVYSTTSTVEYTGTGSTTEFAIPFAYLDEDHIHVWVDDVQLVRGSGFSVTPPGLTGSVTLGEAPAQGASVRVSRVLPLRQTLDLPPQGPLPAESIESALDRLVMMIQQLNDGLAVAGVWDHGVWPGGNLHALVNSEEAGFMPPWALQLLNEHNDVIPQIEVELDAITPRIDELEWLVEVLDNELDAYVPSWEDIVNKPVDLQGYGLLDEVQNLINVGDVINARGHYVYDEGALQGAMLQFAKGPDASILPANVTSNGAGAMVLTFTSRLPTSRVMVHIQLGPGQNIGEEMRVESLAWSDEFVTFTCVSRSSGESDDPAWFNISIDY